MQIANGQWMCNVQRESALGRVGRDARLAVTSSRRSLPMQLARDSRLGRRFPIPGEPVPAARRHSRSGTPPRDPYRRDCGQSANWHARTPILPEGTALRMQSENFRRTFEIRSLFRLAATFRMYTYASADDSPVTLALGCDGIFGNLLGNITPFD